MPRKRKKQKSCPSCPPPIICDPPKPCRMTTIALVSISILTVLLCLTGGVAIWAYNRGTRDKCKVRWEFKDTTDLQKVAKKAQNYALSVLQNGIRQDTRYPTCTFLGNAVEVDKIASAPTLCQDETAVGGMRKCYPLSETGTCPKGRSKVNGKNLISVTNKVEVQNKNMHRHIHRLK